MVAFFGSANAVVGLDIGTSSLKLVELINRRRGLELATYAQANLSNLLMAIEGDDEDEIRGVANVVSRMMDSAGVSTDKVVAALPSSVVFSTVLTLPDIAEVDMEEAVHFAARDVVPANLDEMVLGWSKLGQAPQMEQVKKDSKVAAAESAASPAQRVGPAIPVFLTAAPKDLVARYTKLMELLKVDLLALEVETFPLVRALLGNQTGAAMIVDIGDRVTTFHIIDNGTARVSHTMDYGGHAITRFLAKTLSLEFDQAEALKMQHGLTASHSEKLHAAMVTAMQKILNQAKQLQQLYESQGGQRITKTTLIGGGANLRGLPNAWSTIIGHAAVVGNPWKGLAYPKELEGRLQELGSAYAVAVGLAERGFVNV